MERINPYAAAVASGDFSANWSLPHLDGGDVQSFRVSPDGRRVVYLADQETDQQRELFSVSITGGESTKLNPPLAESSNVLGEFEISPDGGTVAFLTGEDLEEPADLFHVPMLGGAATKLDESLVIHVVRDEPTFRFSGSRLLYRSGHDRATVVALHSADLKGSNSTQLSDRGHVSDFEVSGDGRQVFYRADPSVSRQYELFAVPITGGRSDRLNGALVPGGQVVSNFRGGVGFALTADGKRVVYRADQDVNNRFGLYTRTVPEQPDLVVTSLVPDPTGFVIQFNSELDEGRLNLYDAESVGLGETDIVVEGAETGIVSGSLQLDGSRTAARFIKSGGPLAADTYTVRLRSGLDGLQSADQYLLNGDRDGLAGDDYVRSFTMSPAGRVVSLPDIVRAPRQSIDLPGMDVAGIPLSISDGTRVATATFRVEYDPGLLAITDATVGPDMPSGAEVTLDVSTPGAVAVTFASPVSLDPGEQVLLHLQGIVPASDSGDSYGQHQIVRLENLGIADTDGKSIPVVADDGLQMVSLFGDVSLNGRINAFDASRVARVAARIDTGFPANTLVDPLVVADVSGNGIVNAADALWLFSTWVGLDPTDLPPSPPRNDTPLPPPSPKSPSINEDLRATIRLDHPQAIVGDVVDFRFSPDGEFAVYVADSTIDNEFDLYSVELQSGAVRQLSDAFGEGSLLDFHFSPDGSRVVYRTENGYDLVNLYSVSLSGDGSTRLNDRLSDGTSVSSLSRETNLLFSPDGALVVYMADRNVGEPIELFSVSVEGGASTQLVGTLLDGESLWEFEIEVDGGYRLFLRDRNWKGSAELYLINLALGLGSVDTPTYKTSPNGDWDVFIDDADGNLYSKPHLGGEATKLNGTLYSGAPRVEDFLISPESTDVFYVAQQESSRALYKVPISGGDFSKLSSGKSTVSTGIRISPDGSRVVYLQSSDLYSVPASGGGVTVRLSGGLDPSWNRFQISPDSRLVLFHGRYGRSTDPDRTYGIYTAPLAGGGSLTNLATTPALDGIGKFDFSPDGSQVIYVAEQDFAGVAELYRAPVAGGDSHKLSAPHKSLGGTATDIQLSPDGQFLVYRADHDVDDVFDLYAVSVVTGGIAKLSGPHIVGSVEPDFQISADSSRVVYRAHEDARLLTNLYSVRLTGGGTVRLNRLSEERVLEGFETSADGSRVVYQAELAGNVSSGLFSVPLRGGEATRLNGDLDLARFQTTADGKYVIYQEGYQYELFRVPIAGGEATQLNGPLDRQDVLLEFRVTSDGTRVVYAVRHKVKPAVQLFSVLTTGEELTKLNEASGSVQDFQITPDGAEVLFRAGSAEVGLYSIPITGGTATRLSDPAVGEVQPFPVISPDGKRVLYLVADNAKSHFDDTSFFAGELYGVPINGGESTPLIDEGMTMTVQFGYQFAPDGQTVVYRAHQAKNGPIELYRTPISGGAATKLNELLVSGGDVTQFSILPIYDWLIYLADQEVDEQVGIYRARLTRQDAP